jgi:hypothetical protein
MSRIWRTLKGYLFWTYDRGSFHYDVMVTLILAFIFITPHIWDYGDKPAVLAGPTEPILVKGDGSRGLILTVQASDVNIGPAAPDAAVKRALRKAIEPIAGDAFFIERWELARDPNGNPVSWTVWAHK